MMKAIYQVMERSSTKGEYIFQVQFDPQHPVYQGHFPERPITPGVLLTTMVRELFEGVVEAPLQLLEAHSIKFLRMVEPVVGKTFNVSIKAKELEEERYHVAAKMDDGQDIAFKLSCTLGKL